MKTEMKSFAAVAIIFAMAAAGFAFAGESAAADDGRYIDENGWARNVGDFPGTLADLYPNKKYDTLFLADFKSSGDYTSDDVKLMSISMGGMQRHVSVMINYVDTEKIREEMLGGNLSADQYGRYAVWDAVGFSITVSFDDRLYYFIPHLTAPIVIEKSERPGSVDIGYVDENGWARDVGRFPMLNEKYDASFTAFFKQGTEYTLDDIMRIAFIMDDAISVSVGEISVDSGRISGEILSGNLSADQYGRYAVWGAVKFSVTVVHEDGNTYTATNLLAPLVIEKRNDSSPVVTETFESDGFEYAISSIEQFEASITGCKDTIGTLAVPDSVCYKGREFNVISIGDKAFYGCASLISVDLGSVETVGMKAFANCANIKSLMIPDTVKEFRPYAFYGCSSLKSLDIPGDDVIVGTSAFSACKGMESISFTGSGAILGTNSFYKNNKVASIDLSTVASVGFKAFPYCNGIVSLTIPGGLEMGAYAFYGCANLRGLAIEEGVESISKSAFSGCKALSGVSFPSTLKSIGENAFHGVRFYEGSAVLDVTAENLAGKTFIGSGGKLYPAGLSDGDAFEVGGLMYEVTSAAFREASLIGCTEPRVSLEVPSDVAFKGTDLKVVSVGSKAFFHDDSLVSVDLGSVREIDMKAFAMCRSLKEVRLGSSLEAISYYAFYSCPAIEVLDVPSSLMDVRLHALGSLKLMDGDKILSHDAESIAGKIFCGAERVLKTDFDGTFTRGGLTYSVSGSSATLTGYIAPITSLTVPSEVSYGGKVYSVSSVGDKAFYGCSTLTSVDLGSVVSVGIKAFSNCVSLEGIDLGDSLKSIGAYAFYGCRNVDNLDAPFMLQSIGTGAFGGFVFKDASGTRVSAAAENLRGHGFSGSSSVLYLAA